MYIVAGFYVARKNGYSVRKKPVVLVQKPYFLSNTVSDGAPRRRRPRPDPPGPARVGGPAERPEADEGRDGGGEADVREVRA